MANIDQLNQIMKVLDIEAFLKNSGIEMPPATAQGWMMTCYFCKAEGGLRLSPKGTWGCKQCGEKGNVITLYARVHDVSNKDAIDEMKRFLGIILPERATQEQDGTTSENGAATSGAALPRMAPEREVYQRLVDHMTLTDEHREAIKKERGLTDETIDELKFKSGGPYVAQIIDQLRAEFTDQAMIDAGLMASVNGTIVIDQQLIEDRIIIPYLDAEGDVYFLRPHKMGLKEKPPHPYCALLIKDKPEHIVLTEGEFKSAALHQLGIPSVCTPGVQTFGGKHFERLLSILHEFEIKKVTVIFDNEDKGNPEYANYKERPDKRYDTQYWAHRMARMLTHKGINTMVGWLPDEWRGNTGKIDIDGALAQGRTRDEFMAVIQQAMTPAEFLASQNEEAQRILKRKIARDFANVPIQRSFNKYVATRRRGEGESYEEVISNFVINIRSSFYTSEGVIRNVEFANEFGEVSDTFALTPSDMAGLNEFKKFCFSKGNYVFEGKSADLTNVWKYELMRDTGDLIYMPERIGRISDDLWLFGNLAVHTKESKIYRPDRDGIVWVQGRGYRPQSLHVSSFHDGHTEEAIPSLYDSAPVDIVDIAKKIHHAVGGYEAYIALGWVIATIFSEDIFAKYRSMPILFPHGKRESGKTTFMRWIMSFFGVDHDPVGLAETTQNFIARSLSYYSSIGSWFDEYRNEPNVIKKDGFFRSAYNRQLSGKGTASAFQAKGFNVHATVAISGEELPADNGLFTRCIPVQISSYRRNRQWFDWLQRNSQRFSAFTLNLILNYHSLLPKIMQTIEELKQALVARGVTDRTAENWAICAGAFDAIILQDDAFIKWVEERCQDIKATGESEHMLNQFWEDLSFLAGNVDRNKYFKADNGRLYIWMTGAYQEWSVHYRRKTGGTPFDRQTISKYLKDEPYYVGNDKTLWLGGAKRRCEEVNVEHSEVPHPVVELYEMIANNGFDSQ